MRVVADTNTVVSGLMWRGKPRQVLDAARTRTISLFTMVYELADGTIKEYHYGLARIEFMGEITAGRVIFGEKSCEPLLGVTALESVGITVDPANRTLKRLPAIPLKHVLSGSDG